jgi:hypothetical protein
MVIQCDMMGIYIYIYVYANSALENHALELLQIKIQALCG